MTRLPSLAAVALAALPAAATAQTSDWTYSASFYTWFTALGTTVDTPFGEVETELDFGDVWDALDIAFMGSFEARQGRWGLVTDLIYSDLSSEEDTPFGLRFDKAEVETKMTIFSAYAAYRVTDTPDVIFDVAAGFRYYNLDLDTRLVGAGAQSDQTFSNNESWVDPTLGARVRVDFSDRWFGNGFADVGGFGLDDSSELSWQAYAGVGYRFNETWSMQLGYRYMSIEKKIDDLDLTLELSGPMLGVTANF